MDFEEAKPPMVIDTISGGKTMEIDSSFMMTAGYFSPTKPGLYLFQTDSSSGSALSLRLAPFYYPKFVSIDEIISTLRYISSKEEYNKLVSSKTRKKALDNFLLDISGSQDRAKRIMQNYFTRVAEANLLFTGFKEGWKTDAGMIYIIFGHPDVVERNDVGEVWTYLKMEDKSDLKFEFMRVKNIFTPGYLTLIRKDDYDRYWFRFVDLWRKGRI
jgi:GWxTD domain-containing protein